MGSNFLNRGKWVDLCLRAGPRLMLSLVVAGCVSARQYPSAWPPIADSADRPCQSIAGVYRAASDPWPGSGETCSGSSVPNFMADNPSCVSLPYVLGGRSYPDADQVVTIVQGDDAIAYTVPERNSPTELRRDQEYRCSGNRIELIPSKNRNESWNIGGGIDSKRWSLYRGEDGSLLAKFTEKAAGFIICPPMPVALYANRWVRWQPASTEEPRTDAE